jgi:predicted ATPase
MVERVTGGKRLPAEVLQQVVAKTDGVPLFVEELTRMVLESDLLRDQGDRYELSGALPPLAIPSALQDSLMARLDRLATVKEVAQVGAALGRSFHYELLRAIAALDDTTLQRALARLGESDLLHQRGVPADATYVFKHALIQDTAYPLVYSARLISHAGPSVSGPHRARRIGRTQVYSPKPPSRHADRVRLGMDLRRGLQTRHRGLPSEAS